VAGRSTGQSESTIWPIQVGGRWRGAVRINVKLGRSSVNLVEVVQGLQVGDK